MSYRLLIAGDVLEYVEGLPKRDRIDLRNRFVAISKFPSNYSDFREPDETGRMLEIHVAGKFAIKSWEDGADNHLKILDVHLADRSGV